MKSRLFCVIAVSLSMFCLFPFFLYFARSDNMLISYVIGHQYAIAGTWSNLDPYPNIVCS